MEINSLLTIRSVSSNKARDAIKELSQLSAITMPSSSSFDRLNGFRSERYVRMSNTEHGLGHGTKNIL